MLCIALLPDYGSMSLNMRLGNRGTLGGGLGGLFNPGLW